MHLLLFLMIGLFLAGCAGGGSSEAPEAAGAVPFRWEEGQELPTPPMEKELNAIFGLTGFSRIKEYRQQFRNIKEASDFAAAWRAAMTLREEMAQRLDDYLQNRPGRAELPDMFWLQEAFPGFLPQLVAEGTTYHLFADFRQWSERARQTPGQEDDALTGLYLAAFPEDSVEYFFPAWTIQISDFEGHSLLGRGLHRRMLSRIDSVLSRGDRFKPEIEQLKDQLIDDMVRKEVTYWEPSARIVAEVEAILADKLRCLSREDRIALEGRLGQFRDPEVNGIAVNLRSGEE